MTAHSTHLLALDEEGRPLTRVDVKDEWREVVGQLLRLDSQWLILEQQRMDDFFPSPRNEDIRLTRMLYRRLRPMELTLTDHVIHGSKGRFSFREAGLL